MGLLVSDFYQPRDDARVKPRDTARPHSRPSALQRIATVAQQMRKQRALAEQILRASCTL